LAVIKTFRRQQGSIDSSVEFIQSLEQKYTVDLLDKMNGYIEHAHKTID
jgi:hypothetical protein